MSRIAGKVAVVTGATAGIGAACVHSLAEAGVRVIATGRRSDRLQALADEIAEAGGEARPYALDVRDRKQVAGFAEWLETEGLAADILVNNAGLARGLDAVHDGKHDDWDEMIDTNVKGVLNMMRALLPGMVERDAGHVVNVGSIAGYVAYPKGNVYCATKFAVRGLTEGANLDLVNTKVRMSSVDPGLVETEFSLVRFRGDAARASQTYEGVDALRPEDVADAVRYVLEAPPRVNVLHMVVMPTIQRSPFVMGDREL